MRNNNTKIYFIAMVSLLSITVSYGQDTLINQKKGIIIKFSPFLLFGDYITSSAGIPLGVEFRINKKLSLDQNFIYIIPAIEDNSGSIVHIKHGVEKIKGIRTDSEIKRYLNKRNNFTGFYLATHFLYQYTAATIFVGGYENIFRNLIALHEKIGWQSISKKGFVFEVAFGLGIRYTSSKFNYTNPNNIYIFNEYNSLFYWYKKPYEYGNKWFFSVNGSFKIGWAINFNKTKKV